MPEKSSPLPEPDFFVEEPISTNAQFASDEPAPQDKAKFPIPGENQWKGLSAWVPHITEDYLSGLNVQEISHKRGLNPKYIRFIISTSALKELASRHRQEIMEELLREKIPLLREVAGLSLSGLRDFLESLITDREKMGRLTLKDARDLSAIAKEQNDTLRLELGQATEKIEVVQKVEKDVTYILEDLKNTDPFVEYPALKHDNPKE